MVSFKSASHISPSSSASTVRSHEQEHVSNAYSKASTNDGEVVSASVSLKTATCPECGRSYVAGGTTTTQIKYDTSNPYERSRKSYESEALAGQYIDYAA
jgi:transposase-like protein